MLEQTTRPPVATTATPLSPTRAPAPRWWLRLRVNPGFWAGLPIVLFFIAIAILPAPVAGLFGHGDPMACDLAFSRQGPDAAAGHPFGFTVQGCDLYSNVVYGARNSIIIGLAVTVLASLIGITLGLAAGYLGRVADAVISRISEIFIAIPLILGALVVLNSVATRDAWFLSVILALFLWPTSMRIVRSQTFAAKGKSYIAAARALGLGRARIAVVHILPNVIGPVAVLATLSIGGVIGMEAALTYLGIGLQPPAISWGLQLSVAQRYFQLAPHLLIFPSLALTLAITGFVILGESIRTAAHSGSDSI